MSAVKLFIDFPHLLGGQTGTVKAADKFLGLFLLVLEDTEKHRVEVAVTTARHAKLEHLAAMAYPTTAKAVADILMFTVVETAFAAHQTFKALFYQAVKALMTVCDFGNYFRDLLLCKFHV